MAVATPSFGAARGTGQTTWGRVRNKNQSDEIHPQYSCRDQRAVDETSPPSDQIPSFNYT